MKNLSGLRVLVTRPSLKGRELCQSIESQGGQAIHLPTIDFAPVPEALFQQTLNTLGEQDWLIFISPQAVHASIALIKDAWPALEERVKLAAVGAGTAKALNDAGFHAIYPPQKWGSLGLLELPNFQSIAQKKITLVRGVGGRALLEKTLGERGAMVSHLIAYQRVLPKVDVAPVMQLMKKGEIHAIVATSFDGVNHLKILLDDVWPYLKSIPLVVVSERIKELAGNLGFQTIWLASNASHAAIIKALCKKE